MRSGDANMAQCGHGKKTRQMGNLKDISFRSADIMILSTVNHVMSIFAGVFNIVGRKGSVEHLK
jgi:hypothetical protein